MKRAEAEHKLSAWGTANAQRDFLVKAANDAGVSVNRIHVLTGLGRSTIYRILNPGCPDCGRSSCTGEECYWPGDAGLRGDGENTL